MSVCFSHKVIKWLETKYTSHLHYLNYFCCFFACFGAWHWKWMGTKHCTKKPHCCQKTIMPNLRKQLRFKLSISIVYSVLPRCATPRLAKNAEPPVCFSVLTNETAFISISGVIDIGCAISERTALCLRHLSSMCSINSHQSESHQSL